MYIYESNPGYLNSFTKLYLIRMQSSIYSGLKSFVRDMI